MSACAYCNGPGPFTKEHIWPKSLLKKYESLKAFNPRRNVFHGGELVVKDVCATCNNDMLSPLDTYLSDLFDRAFASIIAPGESATLQYNYELLLRSLLKVSYNSSRATVSDATRRILSRYASFITHGGHPPPIALRLQVVTSSRTLNIESLEEGSFRPCALRAGSLGYTGRLSNRFTVRLVALNSFWFYLVLAHKTEPPHKWRDFLAALGDWTPLTGVPLAARSSSVLIQPDQTTYFHPALLGSLVGPMQA
jgi:hypothetical protein